MIPILPTVTAILAIMMRGLQKGRPNFWNTYFAVEVCVVAILICFARGLPFVIIIVDGSYGGLSYNQRNMRVAVNSAVPGLGTRIALLLSIIHILGPQKVLA